MYKSREAGEQFKSILYNSPGSSSVDCVEFPDSPACTGPPPVNPVSTDLTTCTPSDGVWSSTGTGSDMGRSTLLSPCCQPTDFSLAKGMKTCDDTLDVSDPIQLCVQNCCANADNEANNYDASWYPMARCACSLWCYNQDIPHFKKYGTAVHYITGDIAEATTGDEPNFIGSGTFSG